MNSLRETGKTIGEVAKLTGTPKRKLKYMIERNIMQPSQRTETGFWLYSEGDIQTVRTVTLLQQLGFNERRIRALVAAPISQWPEDLEEHISLLMERKEHIEDQLFQTELLRFQGCIEKNAPQFSVPENDYLSAWKSGKREALCRFLIEAFSEAESVTPLRQLSLMTDRDPGASAVQEQIQSLCDLLRQDKELSPAQLLLILRLAHTSCGLVPVLDTVLNCEGAVQFITAAMQYYCEHR